MKKILFTIISAFLLLCSSVTTFAQSSEDSFFYWDTNTTTPTTNFHTIIQNDVVDANDGVLKKILRIFNLDQFTTLSDAPALEFVKYILNIALWLVSFVAVVVIIYGFVQVIFAKDEEWVTKARKTVQWAAIAIAIIAVSWFLVSFLFDLYGRFIQP
jgi:amino acid transporter